MRRFIEVRHRFEGFHCWPTAPMEVCFLQAIHRHEFHVRLRIAVNYNDRELEFILLKRWLANEIKSAVFPVESSCESIAEYIILKTQMAYGARSMECEVSEDGENGAVLVVD